MTEQDIVQLFANWNAALQTGDPDQVTALYAKDAILLPTVSNQVRHNHAEIRDYFVNFLSKKPQGVIDEANTRHLAEDLVSNAGAHPHMPLNRIQVRCSPHRRRPLTR